MHKKIDGLVGMSLDRTNLRQSYHSPFQFSQLDLAEPLFKSADTAHNFPTHGLPANRCLWSSGQVGDLNFQVIIFYHALDQRILEVWGDPLWNCCLQTVNTHTNSKTDKQTEPKTLPPCRR